MDKATIKDGKGKAVIDKIGERPRDMFHSIYVKSWGEKMNLVRLSNGKKTFRDNVTKIAPFGNKYEK